MTDIEPEITREHLQKLYDDLPDQTPRELPKIQMGGDEYYVDGRLHEIRNIEDPSDKVSFDQIDTMNAFASSLKKGAPEDVETGGAEL